MDIVIQSARRTPRAEEASIKALSTATLICLIAIYGAAQSSSDQSQPSGIDVTIRTRGTFSKVDKSTKKSKPKEEKNFDSVFTADISSKPFPQSDVIGNVSENNSPEQFPQSTRSQPPPDDKPEMIISITNKTGKKIRYVEWEIVFNDSSKAAQTEPLRFAKQINIASGDMQPLVRWKDLNKIPAPLHEYALGGWMRWRVLITQIRYEDGSIWKAQP
jgi:hypothetical protein